MEITVKRKTVFAATGGRPFDPALPAVVFLHGAGLDHTVWALQTRYFAYRNRSVLALDLPGHGKSKGPALKSVPAIADWVIAVLDALGVERAALVGHSMGALAALDAAGRHGARVSHLALLGVAGAMPVHPDLLASAKADDHLAFDLVTSWGHGPVGHLGGNRAPGLWIMGGGERLLERARPGVLYHDLAACNAYKNAPGLAPEIAAPCLLVLGADDRMTPAKAGQKLAAMIPGARVELLAGCGHMMMTEKPDLTLDALKGFL
ncbi:MAG: alpha/beta hydrolase [Pseudomonadota bacterium]